MFSQTQDNMRLKKIYLLFTFGTLFVCWVVFVQWPSKTDRSQLSFDYDLKVTEERSNRFSSRDNFEFRTVTTSVSLSGRETKIKYQTNKSATWPGFQVVHFPGSEFYVYSALLDEDRVVIIALKKREAQIKGLYCAYSLPGGGGVEQRWTSLVEAYVTNLSDHHDKLYTPAFIICALGKQSSESTAGSVGDNSTRRMVILVNGRDSADKPLAELQLETGSQRLGRGSSAVEGSDKGNNRDEVEFTVCSSIFHDNYNNAEQLVEMLELNRLLGAGRVVLYDNSVSDNVKDVLAMYAREWAEGRESLQVLLLPWKLPALFHHGNLHYFGQMAAINDCLYRFRHSSRYTVVTDLDEFIIPRQASNWSDLIGQAVKAQPNLSGFLFQNTIFRRQWPSAAKGFQAVAEKYKSVALGHTQREDYVFPVKIRSKMIVDPKLTEEMGIHYAWRMSGETYNVPQDIGLVHHYRDALPKDVFSAEDWKKSSKQVSDQIAVDVFGNRLADLLEKVWSKMPGHAPSENTLKEKKLRQALPKTSAPQFRLVQGLVAPVFTYAALWEYTGVRVVAMMQRGKAIKDLSCVFLNSMYEISKSFAVHAVVKEIPEHHNKKYTAAYITCDVDEKHRRGEYVPAFVGLVANKNLATGPDDFLPIDRASEGRTGDRASSSRREEAQQFTVCTPVMFNKLNNAAELVELVEMSRLLGAGRVVLYNESITSNLDTVLSMYNKEWEEGRDSLEVKVHPWTLPSLVENGVRKTIWKEEDIHYFGQMAAIDHCLHRYRHLSRYIVFTDLDEFIFPVRHANWSQLVAERQGARRPAIAGFMFQNTVFNRDRPSPATGFESDVRQYGSAVLGFTSRDDYFFPHKMRSKMIVDPKVVDEMGIHFIWKGSGRTDQVPVDQGFLAHYRMPLFDCKPQVKDSSLADRFGKQLVSALRQIWSKLQGVTLGWDPDKQYKIKDC